MHTSENLEFTIEKIEITTVPLTALNRTILNLDSVKCGAHLW